MLKKIFLFYPSFENGGATENLINIINFLLKRKISVVLFSYKVKKSRFKNKKYLKVIENKPLKIFLLFPIRWNLALSSMINLFSYSNKHKDNSIIFSMQSHIPAIIISKIIGKKIVIRNSEEPLGATRYADNKFFAIIVLFLKLIFYNFADKIIAISKRSEKSLQKIVINKKKIKLILNPYLKKIFKRKKNKFNQNESFRILYIGRLTFQKNLFPLIETCKNLSLKNHKIQLTIIGDGKLKNKILEKTNKFKNIKICNWKIDVKNDFLKSDLFILNSFYEGLPNVLIDAVNYEVPCISSDVSGARDILLDGKGGYIVPINNQKKLEDKIVYIIKNYKEAKKKALYAKTQIDKLGKSNLNIFYKTFLKLVNYQK
ncbi:glycosyltransferase [Candidatus Pelagibacter sp.]|nr:glycosyltransferase [Candidatus Pelagibacter sp.]